MLYKIRHLIGKMETIIIDDCLDGCLDEMRHLT